MSQTFILITKVRNHNEVKLGEAKFQLDGNPHDRKTHTANLQQFTRSGRDLDPLCDPHHDQKNKIILTVLLVILFHIVLLCFPIVPLLFTWTLWPVVTIARQRLLFCNNTYRPLSHRSWIFCADRNCQVS